MKDKTKALFNWDEEDDDTNIADDTRGDQETGISRSQRLANRIIEALKAHSGKAPDRDSLQRMAGIKRRSFIAALKELISNTLVVREGHGCKGSPFRYRLKEGVPINSFAHYLALRILPL